MLIISQKNRTTKNYQLITGRGFTLIETLLYMAIISIVVSTFVFYGINIIQSGAKSSHQEEANSAARNISQKIKYEIRNASGINSVSANLISLSETDSAIDPTIISYSNGGLTIKRGSGPAIALNPSSTNITSLAFADYSSLDNNTKNIQFIFTIECIYPSIGNIKESMTVTGDAELRSN